MKQLHQVTKIMNDIEQYAWNGNFQVSGVFNIISNQFYGDKQKILHSFISHYFLIIYSFIKKTFHWIKVPDLEFGNFWKFCINGFPHVIKWWSSENDSSCAKETSSGEKPQEKAVKNHGNILPVFYYLKTNFSLVSWHNFHNEQSFWVTFIVILFQTTFNVENAF